MDNNQLNNNTLEEKYIFYKDKGFLFPFNIFILTLFILINILYEEGKFEYWLLSVMILSIVWMGWIFYNKGKNGSFLVGFLIGMVFSAIGLYYSTQIETKQREERLEQRNKEIDQEMEQKFNKQLEEFEKLKLDNNNEKND